jgi:hypothetical protein
MAKELTSVDQLRNALPNILPGFKGDKDKALLEILGVDKLPTEKADLAALQDKAKALLEGDLKDLVKFDKYVELDRLKAISAIETSSLSVTDQAKAEEAFKKATEAHNKFIADNTLDAKTSANDLRANLEKVIGGKTNAPELAKYAGVLTSQAHYLQVGEKLAVALEGLEALDAEKAQNLFKTALNITNAKDAKDTADMLKEFSTKLGELKAAHVKGLEGEELKAAEALFKNAEQLTADTFKDVFKGVTHGFKDAGGYATELAGKVNGVVSGKEALTNVQALDYAADAINDQKVVVEQSKGNLQKFAQNISGKFKEVSKDIGKAVSGIHISNKQAGLILAGTTALAVVAGRAVGKEKVRDEAGNVELNDDGSEKTRVNGIKATATAVGAVVAVAALDHFLLKGQTRAVVGQWTGMLANRASNLVGRGK